VALPPGARPNLAAQGASGPSPGLTLDLAAVTLAEAGRPEIVEFAASEDGRHVFSFAGQVNDTVPGGLHMTFGGLPSLEGATAVTNPDGTFSLTVLLGEHECGTATAVAVNSRGQVSEVAECHVWQTT
jgi:hypothetical protein